MTSFNETNLFIPLPSTGKWTLREIKWYVEENVEANECGEAKRLGSILGATPIRI